MESAPSACAEIAHKVVTDLWIAAFLLLPWTEFLVTNTELMMETGNYNRPTDLR